MAGPASSRDLAGSLIDYAFQSTVQAVAPVQEKRALAIAVATETRLASLLDLPTLKELGYEDVRMDSVQGIAGPKGLPKDVVTKISAALISAAKEPQIAQRAESEHIRLTPGSQEPLEKYIVDEYQRMGAVLKRLNITAND